MIKQISINRKFDIPYNFDYKLLAGLNIIHFSQNNISSIYLPPYEFDYPSIRKNDTMPNEIDYLSHIEMINNQFPGKIKLLLQQPNDNYLMKDTLLQKYINLGITKFCVGSLNQAKEIKNKLSETEITGSISMHITKENIENNQNEYIQYFNNFVLDFSYNKNLKKIQNMPKNFKYSLIINSLCNINCTGNFHWFGKYENFQCPYPFEKSKIEDLTLINPTELYLYDNDIDCYKLVERGWPTQRILKDLITYNIDFSLYKNEV